MLYYVRVIAERLAGLYDYDGKGPPFGGFPRMTFFTLDSKDEPTIVLGFTASSWSSRSKPLRNWAIKARDASLDPYKDHPFLERRRRALAALPKVSGAPNQWSPADIERAIKTQRQAEGLKPFGQGRRGSAIEFPSLTARMRCNVCLSSTEYSIAAEGEGGVSKAMNIKAKFTDRHAASCAEVETSLIQAFYLMDYWLDVGSWG